MFLQCLFIPRNFLAVIINLVGSFAQSSHQGVLKTAQIIYYDIMSISFISCCFFPEGFMRMDLRTQGGGRVSWNEVREGHGHIYTTKCKIDS